MASVSSSLGSFFDETRQKAPQAFVALLRRSLEASLSIGLILKTAALVLLGLVSFTLWGRRSRITPSAARDAKTVETVKPGKPQSQNVALLYSFPPSTSRALGIESGAVSGRPDDMGAAKLQAMQIPVGCTIEQCSADMRTPTDMTINNIKSVGDFPDYSKLTGVRHPEPYRDFDLSKAFPRLYRPLRWQYVQNLSLMKFEPDWWLEVTHDYKLLIEWRRDILAEHGTHVLDWRPGTELAAKETMEMALQFYTKRYPLHFQLECRSDAGWVFVNKILETETIIRNYHPLEVLFQNIPEEFMIVMRNPEDGLYYLRGGICCSAVGWSMGQKMDKPLSGVHAPVPDYKKNMAFSMDRFFAKLPCDRPIQRGSWELRTGRPLFVPPPSAGSSPTEKDYSSVAIEDVTFRVDWQSVRRLPLSGAVIFNFRCLFTPLPEFRDEKNVPALFHKILTESNENLLAYKHTASLEHIVLPYLQLWVSEQKKSGMMDKDWEVRTLDESPFFEGWKEKWHRGPPLVRE